MKIYRAAYNPCVEESTYGTLSLHLSREGAKKAIDDHREKEYKEWKRLYPSEYEEPFPFGTFQKWHIFEEKVLQ